MNPHHGDLLALLGLLEGVTSAAEGGRLRERLAEEPELRSRMQKLRGVADRISDPVTGRGGHGTGLSEEVIAAFVDGHLSEEAARKVEAALWESETLLAEAISTYRFVRTPLDLPATRTRSTAGLFALFPSAEGEGTVDSVGTGSDLHGSSLLPLETPSVETASLETASPEGTTRERRLPAFDPVPPPRSERRPPVVSRRPPRRRNAGGRGRRTAIVVVACGVGLIALLAGLAWWQPGDPSPPVVEEDRPPVEREDASSDEAIVDREPIEDRDEVPVPRADPFVLVPKLVVGALFARRDDAWLLVDEPLAVDEAESLVVPGDCWAEFEFAGSSFVLAGPTELALRTPTSRDGHVRTTISRGRLAVTVPNEGTPVRCELGRPAMESEPDEASRASLSTEGRDASFAVTATDGRQRLQVVEGAVVVDGRRVAAPRSLSRAAGGAWSDDDSASGEPSWRKAPTSRPDVQLLADRLRGSPDVVGTLLSARGARSRLAARWALDLDEERAIESLVARAKDDRDDALLFALAARDAGDPATQRAWRAIGERLGNPRLGGKLAAWHELATNRKPLDMETARELIRGLGHEHVLVRSVAIRTLRAKTGSQLPYDPRGTSAERMRAARAWTAELRKRVPGGNATPPRSRPMRRSR